MVGQKLAVFDIDGTFFRWQLYYEIVLVLKQRGFFDDATAAEIDSIYHAWQSRKDPFKVFEEVAIRALSENLHRLEISEFQSVVQQVLDESSHKVYKFTQQLAETLKKDGYFLLAISGSQQEIAEPFSKLYGFDDCIGWLYGRNDKTFSGEVVRNTVSDKKSILNEYVQKHGYSLEQSVGIGDSKSDIPFLAIVEHPIAFNPAKELLDEALEKGWQIVLERKNIAYHLEKDAHGSVVLAKTEQL